MVMGLSAFFQSGLNVRLVKALPAGFFYGYMQLLGRLYYLLRPRERRLIGANIRDMLGDRSKPEIRRIVTETFNGIFAHYFEKLFSAFKEIDQIRSFIRRKVVIENLDLVDDALERGNGVILVTAHWGAVEFIPWVLALAGYPVSVVLECATTTLEAALTEKARHVRAELLTCSPDASIFHRAVESLKANRLLMTECDEVDTWHKRKNRTIDLFGKTLYLDNTLNILARKSGARVVGVFLKRVSRSRYTLICEPVETHADPAAGALALWQKYVSLHPDQWYQWKKWRAMKVAS